MLIEDVELIEPVKVHFKQINKQATTYANSITGRRETQNYVAREAQSSIDAQISFSNNSNMPGYSQMGVDEQANGYILVRYKDMAALGITLKRGDKIVKIGQIDTNYFLLHGNGDPAAHFSGPNQFTLIKLFFSDREPKE